MITIRNGSFETNSSSCHVFAYRPGEPVTVPATVTLQADNEDTILNTMFTDFYWFYSDDEPSDDLCKFLYRLHEMGVQKVNCADKKVEELFEAIKKGECEFFWGLGRRTPTEIFKSILFGPDTKVLTIPEGCSDCTEEELEERFGKGYEFYIYRLS